MVLEVQRHEEKIQKINKIIDNNHQDRAKQTTTKINYDQEKEARIEEQKEMQEERKSRKEAEKKEQTLKTR